jgi:hypothetical protein
MTSEERMKLYDDFHSGVRMMMDKVEKIAKSEAEWTLDDMGKMADMMKDLAVTEKSIAKAHHCYAEHSDKRY